MAKRLKILIVEDEFISRILLKEMLGQFGDCELASDGREAMDVLQQSYGATTGNFDLVCLDIMMPYYNGHEVLKEMRRLEEERNIAGVDRAKVMMVTALDDAKNVMEAVVIGKCQSYITKPVSRERLHNELHTLQLIDS